MANYRFKTAEIEAMKQNILTHIEHEIETKTAWRLRCAIEGQLMCCRPSKRETARLERELALYEKLTKNDLPNWQSEPIQPATPTETPQISTQTAETVNVSAENEKTAGRVKYRVSRFGGYKIIVGDREQGKVVAVLMSVNGHNIIEVNDETAHISTMGEKPLQIDRPIMQLSDAEVLELIYKPTQPQDEPRETENKPTVADVAQMVKTELAKNKAMRTAWHLEFPDGTMCDIRHKSTAAGCDFYEYTEVREGEETFKDYKATERDITLYICQLLDLDAPQSPEALYKVA